MDGRKLIKKGFLSDNTGLAVILSLFLLFLLLCSRFPYVSDDWVWGSYIL